MYPKIYLAIDNCFAYKRWVSPDEWMRRCLDCGYKYIEASADTECDPLYMGDKYMSDWVKLVRLAEKSTGAKVANLYSGHGTYTTLGLMHPDARVRRRFIDEWFKPMVDAARDVNAGLGFYAHGFANTDIQNPSMYQKRVDELFEALADIANHARERGLSYLSLEQMYTPHMYPWTLKTAEDTLRGAYALAGYPTYLTVDVGHMAGQSRFIKPTEAEVAHASQSGRRIWVGTERAHKLLADKRVAEVMADIEQNPQLFTDSILDSDPYAWLERFGCYSPIIHLQQADNKASAHRPFTPENNKTGIIEINSVLSAIKKSYDAPEMPGMPPKCGEIYLTVEVFCATAHSPYDLLDELTASAEYLRAAIPEDGLTLDKLAER